jgi:hypothetical protein
VYLRKKYGYTARRPARRLRSAWHTLLRMLAARLQAQRAAGSGYYIGTRVGAVDVYSAAPMAMFRPLPARAVCDGRATRQAFEFREPVSEAALDPILLAHRDRMYAEHLELPLSL